MEFNEKLQELRKQKGLTQEQLAARLYVSRTAVSKWESGRGYPTIDSLKRIAEVFAVSVDDLLDGGELLTVAEEDRSQKRDLTCGLLDMAALLLLGLPLFAQRSAEGVQSVSLVALDASPLLKAACVAAVIGIAVCGVLTLALQDCRCRVWVRSKQALSLLASAVGILLCTVGLHPYAATYLFVFLIIKLVLPFKTR